MPRLLTLILVCAMLGLSCTKKIPIYKIKQLKVGQRAILLPNGLRAVVSRDPTLTEVTVTLRIGVGSAFDPPERKGLAHFIEHLAFRMEESLGRKKVPTEKEADTADETKDAAKDASAAKDAGETTETSETKDEKAKKVKEVRTVTYLAKSNAYTSPDETFYYSTVVPTHVPDVIEWFSKILQDFTPSINAEVFDVERNVVLNERRQRYEDTPERQWQLHGREHLYPAGHPYRFAGIGKVKTIKSITLEDMQRFVSQHYHPSNAVVSIVGPVDIDATLAQIEKTMAVGIKKEPSVLPATARDWKPTYREHEAEVAKLQGGLVAVAWPLPSSLHQDTTHLRVLDWTAGVAWEVSHFTDAYSVGSWVETGELESVFWVVARSEDPDDIDDMKETILDAVEEKMTKREGEADMWFSRAKSRLLYDSIYSLEDPFGRARQLAHNFAHFGRPDAFDKGLALLNAADPAVARNLSEHLLTRERAFVIVNRPAVAGKKTATKRSSKHLDAKKDGDSSRALHEKRETVPDEFALTQSYADYEQLFRTGAEYWKNADSFELENGIKVRVVQTGSLPILTVRTTFNGGYGAEPQDARGVAHALNNAMGFDNWRDGVRAWRIGGRGNRSVDATTVEHRYKYLSLYADDAFRLTAMRVFDPKISVGSMYKTEEAGLRGLKRATTDADSLAYRAYWRYRGLEGLAELVTEDTVESLTRFDVYNYYDRIFFPENMVLSVASDRPLTEIRPLIEQYFGEIDRADLAPVDSTAVDKFEADIDEKTLLAVSVDDTSQSTVMYALAAPGEDDEPGTILAQSVSAALSRRAKTVRETLGVTYGVSVSLRNLASYGSLVLSTQVERDATVAAIRKLEETVAALRKESLLETEVDFIKRGLVRRYAGLGRSTDSVTSHHSEAMIKEHPLGFETERLDLIASLNAKKVTEGIDQLLSGNSLLIVVGNTDGLEKLATELGRKLVTVDSASLLK